MKPTEPGFYWYWEDSKWVPVEVAHYYDGILFVLFPGSDSDGRLDNTKPEEWGPEIIPPPRLVL